MDAVTSFSHLTTNVPDWIQQLDRLSKHAAEKHAEYAAEYSRLLHTATLKRVKSPSVTSIHSHDDKPVEPVRLPIVEGAIPTAAVDALEFAEISPFEAGNRYLYAQARRKRKATPSVNSGASNTQTFRSRQAVVIYYDSFLQERLDTMVKNIASARNNIRKGKMSRSLQKGLQLPTFSRRSPETRNISEDLALPHIRSTMSLPIDPKGAVARTPPPSNDTCFCLADKQLEGAQSLCETAAHQFLRDGDCKVELEGVKAKFEGILALAVEALPQLQAEKQSEEEAEESRTNSDTMICEKPSQELFTQKIAPRLTQFPNMPAPNLVVPGAPEIEVDEDDGSSIDVDITKFRNARVVGGRMGLRSGR
jgi:hypothetical protein